MESNGLSFRDSLVFMLLFLLTAGFLACSLALHALAANLPYLILAGAASVCLIAVTVTKCSIMIARSRREYYLDDRDYDSIPARCREVKPAGRIRGLIGGGRR